MFLNKRIFGVLALSAALAACGGDEAGEGEGVESDTTAIQGTDTVSVPQVVPATDSVITTTTVDTVQGEGQTQDTAAHK